MGFRIRTGLAKSKKKKDVFHHTAADYMMMSHDKIYVTRPQVGSSAEVYASQPWKPFDTSDKEERCTLQLSLKIPNKALNAELDLLELHTRRWETSDST